MNLYQRGKLGPHTPPTFITSWVQVYTSSVTSNNSYWTLSILPHSLLPVQPLHTHPIRSRIAHRWTTAYISHPHVPSPALSSIISLFLYSAAHPSPFTAPFLKPLGHPLCPSPYFLQYPTVLESPQQPIPASAPVLTSSLFSSTAPPSSTCCSPLWSLFSHGSNPTVLQPNLPHTPKWPATSPSCPVT